MVRWFCGAALTLMIGCGPNGLMPSAPPRGQVVDKADATRAAAGVEVFEGLVDLFGTKIRARREVALDAQGNYVKNGRAVGWYENGQKAGEMFFVDDVAHGPERAWHENGKKKLVGQSENGLATGVWIEWYDNGAKQSEGEYFEGERHGEWTFWDASGRVTDVAEFQYGRKTRTTAGRPAPGLNR